ncbi:MAG TPA: prephenate dehydrogenase [Bacteroidales bacterium]|nr:prephenate dehydrogenase [Bacteroidales bacterium]HPS16414.1 prephenate dehydrogenase [Bacteroidales bacterium]
MKTTIIGLGLIGGSIAIDLRKRGFTNYIIGVDNNIEHGRLALQHKLVDEILPLENAIECSELIIIATPVDAILTLLPKILYKVKNQVVTDIGSTKEKIVELIRHHPNRKNFVAGHPMAGTEKSGPLSAISGLFDNKCMILCDIEDSDAKAVATVKKMYDVLKMNILILPARTHDIHAAYVSHISHVSSYALALTVMDIEKDEKKIFNLASGGFESTVRLAKSPASMWTPIFLQNNENVITALNNYIDKLNELKIFIKEKRDKELFEMINKSNQIKKTLEKPL